MSAKARRIDRRVLRTRKAIMEAFDRLVVRNGIDKITVSALAREADIDRKTFYLHYSSISDLVQRRTEADLERVLRALRDRGVGKSAIERVHVVLEEVNAILLENLAVYQNMASHLSSDQILDRFEQAIRPVFERAGVNLATEEKRSVRMRLQFYVAGALSLYVSWLASDHATPIEVVSDTVESAVRKSVFPTLAPEIL